MILARDFLSNTVGRKLEAIIIRALLKAISIMAKRLGIRHALIILVEYNYAIVELTESGYKMPDWTVVAEPQHEPDHILH